MQHFKGGKHDESIEETLLYPIYFILFMCFVTYCMLVGVRAKDVAFKALECFPAYEKHILYFHTSPSSIIAFIHQND